MQLGGDRFIRAVKRAVDRNPRPGQFILTASTNFLTVPTISESLAGRAAILRLWPLAQAEIDSLTADPLASLFTEAPLAVRSTFTKDDYLERLSRGGYPEVQSMPAPARGQWFQSYAETVTSRDILALTDIRRATALAPLLRYVTAMSGHEFTAAGAAKRLGIGRDTVNRYLEWLEAVFLVHRLPSWARSPSARAVKRPKLHLTDTGLAVALLGKSPEALARPADPATGPLLESYATAELAK